MLPLGKVKLKKTKNKVVFVNSTLTFVKLCVKTYCAAILRAKINNNCRKTNRGFAAYEARQGGVVEFYELK